MVRWGHRHPRCHVLPDPSLHSLPGRWWNSASMPSIAYFPHLPVCPKSARDPTDNSSSQNHLGLASKCQILAGPRAQMAACMHIRARVPVCLCACAPVRLCACVTTPPGKLRGTPTAALWNAHGTKSRGKQPATPPSKSPWNAAPCKPREKPVGNPCKSHGTYTFC